MTEPAKREVDLIVAPAEGESPPVTAQAEAGQIGRPSAVRRAFDFLWSFDGLAKTALLTLSGLFLMGVLGQLGGLGGAPTEIVGPRLAPPSADWPLGTDSLGRSLLPRLLEGITTTLVLSTLAVILTTIVSTVLGVIAGYRGGKVGGTIVGIGDILYAFPALVLAILVTAVIGPGYEAVLASIVLVTVPLMTRMIGSASRKVAQRDFVTSAIVSGVSSAWILVRHIFRNVSGTIAVQSTFALSVAVLVEGALSFLGFGVQPPAASLGSLVAQGAVYMVLSPLLLLAPGVALVVAILCINVVGDSLRDRLEPREVRSLT